MSGSDTYFIKEGYTARDSAVSFDEAPDDNYWSEARIETSTRYQYRVYELAASLISARGAKSFMDIGCGYPRKIQKLILPLCEDITVLDQPNTEKHVNTLLPKASFHPVNLEKSELDLGRTIDVIVCADVIEHLVDPVHSVDLMKRHMGPDSLLILSTPERDNLRGKDCMSSPKPDHVREWNQAEFRKFVEFCGLNVVSENLFPQDQLSNAEFSLSKLCSPRWGARKRWYSCLTLVCQLPENN